MRSLIFTLLLAIAVCFSSCQKETITPVVTPARIIPGPPASSIGLNQTSGNVTITGYLRIQMAKDATNTDNILIDFKPGSETAFNRSEDAPSLQGFGVVGLASLSSDNVALSINTMPLTANGATIGLVVKANASGAYQLNLLTVSSIPTTFGIWLKDGITKDSVDFRNNTSYPFNINKSDSTTFGSHRFSVVLRENN